MQDRLDKLLNQYLESPSVEQAKQLGAELKGQLEGNPGPVGAVLKNLLAGLQNINNDQLLSLGDAFLEEKLLSPAWPTIQPQLYTLAKELFAVSAARGELSRAAKYLMNTALLNGVEAEPADLFQSILNVLTALLEEGQPVDAYMGRAHELAEGVRAENPSLMSQYHYCSGKYYFHKKAYLMAAMRFYNACHSEGPGSSNPEQSREILCRAVESTLLAPSGPKKTFLVASLVKDERAKGLKSFNLLQKTHRQITIGREEMKDFLGSVKGLGEVDQEKLLSCTLLIHNIGVAAKHYRDISLEALARRIGCSPQMAEATLQVMAGEGRLSLEIDHLTGKVYFGAQEGEQPGQGLGVFCRLLDQS